MPIFIVENSLNIRGVRIPSGIPGAASGPTILSEEAEVGGRDVVAEATGDREDQAVSELAAPGVRRDTLGDPSRLLPIVRDDPVGVDDPERSEERFGQGQFMAIDHPAEEFEFDRRNDRVGLAGGDQFLGRSLGLLGPTRGVGAEASEVADEDVRVERGAGHRSARPVGPFGDFERIEQGLPIPADLPEDTADFAPSLPILNRAADREAHLGREAVEVGEEPDRDVGIDADADGRGGAIEPGGDRGREVREPSQCIVRGFGHARAVAAEVNGPEQDGVRFRGFLLEERLLLLQMAVNLQKFMFRSYKYCID